MKLGFLWWPAGIVVAVSALACQRELVAPGTCPEMCPGGSPRVVDTVLTPVMDMDSTYPGYIQPGQGVALLVSEGLPVFNSRAVIKFLPVNDSLFVNDTLRTFQVDSMGFRIGLAARDVAATNLQILLYRIPSDVDSSVTFADIEPFLTDSTFIGSIAVDDTTFTDVFRLIVSDSATLDLLSLTPADSGVMAIAVAMSASQPSGISIGSVSAGGAGPLWQTFVTIDSVADTTLQQQTITRITQFNTFVSENPAPIDFNVLTVGGAPSARSLIRFDLTSRLGSRDSSQIVRATLKLIPVAPIPGIPNDSATVRVRGVQTDIGAKSPLCGFNPGALCGSWVITTVIDAHLVPGSSDTISIEVSDLVRGWQGQLGSARSLFLQLNPEASTFTQPEFGSSRTPGFTSFIELTYVLPFPFGER